MKTASFSALRAIFASSKYVCGCLEDKYVCIYIHIYIYAYSTSYHKKSKDHTLPQGCRECFLGLPRYITVYTLHTTPQSTCLEPSNTSLQWFPSRLPPMTSKDSRIPANGSPHSILNCWMTVSCLRSTKEVLLMWWSKLNLLGFDDN